MFAEISEKASLMEFMDIKRNWGRGEYTVYCSRDERR
jgi:hypothetical protein